MKKIFLILLLTLLSLFSNAQVNVSDRIFTAEDWISGIQVAAVKSGIIGSEHVIIVDGIVITSQSHLSAVLESIYSNSIKDYNVLDKEQAKRQFDGMKARNGALLFVLENKAHRRFSKNLRKFKKRCVANKR